MENTPLVKEIPFQDPEALIAVSPREGLIFLDSRNSDLKQGRYSFLGISPRKVITQFDELEAVLKEAACSPHPHLPPFQGGLAGMLGYELAHYLEKLPSRKEAMLSLPDVIIGVYDLVFAWDHQENRAWIFSNGNQAHQRMEWALDILQRAKPLASPKPFHLSHPEIFSTFSKESYQDAVNIVKEYIRAGDLFEANLSQCFSAKWPEGKDPFDLYRQLHHKHPAPFSAYFEYEDKAFISISPERFLKLSQGKVETRPIKGTRPRSNDPDIDQRHADALLQSEKDRAENIMIVDLMRNDLSRVCQPHSVKVSQLCALESFSTVHHLVSAIEGQLKPNMSAIDLLKATFPGGSITGAPKIRAMEIIQELEPYQRQAYCGSMGYIGFNGEMDLSITIRTIVKSGEMLTFQSGGAVTLDSDPEEEYFETLTKAASLKQALLAKDKEYG